MISITRTNSSNPDFINLVRLLDSYLAEKDGDEHLYYSQFNGIDQIKHVVVAYDKQKAVGCGAFKPMDHASAEIKRMYVSPESRGQEIGSKILAELESWAVALDFEKCMLETGTRQPDAIALYKKNGYSVIPNYGPYTTMENSVCFEKKL